MRPLVSVILPTYQSAKTLERALASIQSQTYTPIEIIVVDHHSTDETRAIAERYTKHVYTGWPERTFQKNIWIREAAGKYVCFVDSDMELSEQVVKACVESLEQHPELWGICIPERSVWAWLLVKIRDFERSFYAGTTVESARFFRLDDVRAVGWFEEGMIYFEESLLPQKIESQLGKSTRTRVYTPILHHEWHISLGSWLQKKFYYGKTLRAYIKRSRELGITPQPTRIFWRIALFFRQPKWYRHPLLALGVISLKALELMAVWLGALWWWLFFHR